LDILQLLFSSTLDFTAGLSPGYPCHREPMMPSFAQSTRCTLGRGWQNDGFKVVGEGRLLVCCLLWLLCFLLWFVVIGCCLLLLLLLSFFTFYECLFQYTFRHLVCFGLPTFAVLFWVCTCTLWQLHFLSCHPKIKQPSASRKLQMTIGGAFHAGVEVYGHEWSYGKRGVISQLPRTAEDHIYRCRLLVGKP